MQTQKQRDVKVGLLLESKIFFVVVAVLSCVSLSALVQHCPEEPSAVLGLLDVHLPGLGLVSKMAVKCISVVFSCQFLFFFHPLKVRY